METTATYELELHHARYIEESLNALYLPAIDLSVPSIGETMLINASEVPETRPIVVNIEEPGKRVSMLRTDMNICTYENMPIQMQEADSRKFNYGQELFGVAVNSLVYSRIGKYTWEVNVDESNINDTHMFREFTGILFNFARMKQVRLEEAA